ncbi:glycosyltransferase family 4 protein [Picosynechococcus sp. NKBG042902]|uniref:glycosyltransferase family 4 protein n=1 Tax=Picosynechococcus sp. NKBG042902 TaxID=490193 RepID=UPI0009FFC472|nr:glycosyltransferase family 4 protein [Picosynechococcus sp. NKBG042902]
MYPLDKLRSLSKPIAFGHYSAKNDVGGVTSWLERMLLRLHSDGVPVTLLLHHFGKDIEESSILSRLRDAGISVEIETRSLFTEDDVRGILAFLNRHQPQIFLPQCLESMYYAGSIAGRFGLPWALSMRSDDPLYWAIAEMVTPETSGGMLVGVSEYICNLAKEKHLAKYTYTVPSGTPLSPHTASFSDSPFRVAFSGRVVEEQKRISLVLAAMVQACRLDSRIECLILGDGAARTTSEEWVKAQGLGDRIHFLGRLEPSAVQAQLAQCQALLLMSDYEGLPVALLEGMASGVVPVVRSIPSGIPEIVKHTQTGLLVDDTPEQAATAIINLANNPDLWLRCSLASKLLITQNYSEEVCYQRWLNVIAELSDRSTVRYPIPIPRKIPLPPPHPVLARRDRRKPTISDRVFSKVKRLKSKVQHFIIG